MLLRRMVMLAFTTVLSVAVILAVLAVATSSDPAGVAALIGLLAVVIGVGMTKLRGIKLHPLSFFALFTYSHAALFILRPAFAGAFQDGANLFSGSRHDGMTILAAAIAAAGYLAMAVGYTLSHSPGLIHSPTVVMPIPRKDWRIGAPMIVAIILTGMALYSIYVQQVGGLAALINLSSGRSVELTNALSGTSGYFTSGLLFTLGASTLIFTQGLAANRPALTVAGLILAVVATGPQLLSGSRSVFLPLAITLLVCFVRTRPGVIKAPLAVAAFIPAFVIFFILPRILRQDAQQTGENSLTSALQPNEILRGFFGGLDTAMLDAFALQVSAQTSGSISSQGGATYLSAIASFVPRDFWPNKPESVDTVLNQSLFPMTASRGIGFSFSVYSEPYLNFGVFGVVLIIGVFGVILGRLDMRLQGGLRTLPLAALALFAGTIFPVVRGSISFDTQRFLIPAIPLLAVALVLHLRSERARSRYGQLAMSSASLMSDRNLPQDRARAASRASSR